MNKRGPTRDIKPYPYDKYKVLAHYKISYNHYRCKEFLREVFLVSFSYDNELYKVLYRSFLQNNFWQPNGQRVEDKIKWAKEILAIYEPTESVSEYCLSAPNFQYRAN